MQPIRELFAAIALVCVGIGCVYYYRSGSTIPPIAYMEVALIMSILAETYARD